MRSMSSIGIAQVIFGNRNQILNALDLLNFSFHDTCMYWPYIFSCRLKDDVEIYVRKSIIHCVVRKDLRTLYPCQSWIVPFSNSVEEFQKDLSFIVRDQISIGYFPEEAIKLLRCEDKYLSNVSGVQSISTDYSYSTSNIINLKFDDTFLNDCNVVEWPEHDTDKANIMVSKLYDFGTCDTGIINSMEAWPVSDHILKVLVNSSYHTYCVLGDSGGKGFFIEKDGNYVGFGIGVPISLKKWSMLFCINSCKDINIDLFLYKKCAEFFSNYEIMSDGCKNNSKIFNCETISSDFFNISLNSIS